MPTIMRLFQPLAWVEYLGSIRSLLLLKKEMGLLYAYAGYAFHNAAWVWIDFSIQILINIATNCNHVIFNVY